VCRQPAPNVFCGVRFWPCPREKVEIGREIKKRNIGIRGVSRFSFFCVARLTERVEALNQSFGRDRFWRFSITARLYSWVSDKW
jgi:hypothetical protein